MGHSSTIREGANLTGKKGPVDFAGSISRWDTTNFSAINYRRGATGGMDTTTGKDRSGSELSSPKDEAIGF